MPENKKEASSKEEKSTSLMLVQPSHKQKYCKKNPRLTD